MSAAEYADFLIGSRLASSSFDQRFGDGWRDEDEVFSLFKEKGRLAFSEHGYDTGDQFDEVATGYVALLLGSGALAIEGDNYTGAYYRLVPNSKMQVLKVHIANQAVARRIKSLRPDALGRALYNLSAENGWLSVEPSEGWTRAIEDGFVAVPASDRIVTINDNQRTELIEATNDVIKHFAHENSVDGDVGVKDRLLGQLKAGRELIESQTIRAFLLYETLVRSLGFFVNRYQDKALAEAAKRLLDLLFDRVFKS